MFWTPVYIRKLYLSTESVVRVSALEFPSIIVGHEGAMALSSLRIYSLSAQRLICSFNVLLMYSWALLDQITHCAIVG